MADNIDEFDPMANTEDPSMQYDASRPLVQGPGQEQAPPPSRGTGARPRQPRFISSTAPVPGRQLDTGINNSDADASRPNPAIPRNASKSKFSNLLDWRLKQKGSQPAPVAESPTPAPGTSKAGYEELDENDPRTVKVVPRALEVVSSPLGHSIVEQPYQELLDQMDPAAAANAQIRRKPITANKESTEQEKDVEMRAKFIYKIKSHYRTMGEQANNKGWAMVERAERGEKVTEEEFSNFIRHYNIEDEVEVYLRKRIGLDRNSLVCKPPRGPSSRDDAEAANERTSLIPRDTLPDHAPSHILPATLFSIHNPLGPDGDSGKSSSIVTIAAIWNTMMGTSLLTMPWAFARSGIVLGPAVALLMSFTACFTAVVINRLYLALDKRRDCGPIQEFHSVCAIYLDRFLSLIGQFASIVAVIGAAIVYWILMSGFLYNVSHFIFVKASGGENVTLDEQINTEYYSYLNISLDNGTSLAQLVKDAEQKLICPFHPVPRGFLTKYNVTGIPSSVYYEDVKTHEWYPVLNDPRATPTKSFGGIMTPHTAPLWMLVIFPLLCLRSVRLFTRLNSIGTINIMVLFGILFWKAYNWGINVNFSDISHKSFTPLWDYQVYTLSGTLSMGLFIHNALITILKNNENQKNNSRDVSIAFGLVGFCYMVVGVTFYLCFPLYKGCIADNFLDNFPADTYDAFILRIALLVQLVVVYPLLCYIIRSLFLNMVNWRDMKHAYVLIFNLCICVIGIWFAEYYPSVGSVIRWAGAFCGLWLIFVLPSMCYMRHMKKMGTDAKWKEAICYGIITLGIVNFVSQFAAFLR